LVRDHLGANLDAIAEARELGMNPLNAATYQSTGEGTAEVLSAVSRGLSDYRSSSASTTDDFFGGASGDGK
jgi:hypothetical protein